MEALAEAELIKIVEKVTMTGDPKLDEKMLKVIKRACKNNEAFLQPVHVTVLKQLRKNHSEIRLSSFQLLIELFERSHKFRTLVLEDLHYVFEQTLELNNVNLPPPKAAAKSLRVLAAETIHKWATKYGPAYKKLEHGYNYLKQVKKVCFNDLEGRSETERRREEEKKLKMDRIWRERVKATKNQIEDVEADIQDCLTQLDNCVELLLPSPDNFLFAKDEQNDSDHEDDDLKTHGILDHNAKISIDIVSLDQRVKETDDNKEIVQNLKDQHSLFCTKFFPMVKKWSITLTKAGDNCDSNLLKKVIDVKSNFDSMAEKLKPFEEILNSKKAKHDDESSDEDDFIEVPEKSGFEATVKAEDHLFGIDFYARPSTSKMTVSSNKSVKVADIDHKGKNEEFAKLEPEEIIKNLSKNASQKVFINDDNTVWTSRREEEFFEIPGSETIPVEFSETFEEVRWSCRAPLPSGRLCPRKDRIKCPLHGKIIPRDNMGTPQGAEKKVFDPLENANCVQDWQDPALLRDIEAATGINLALKKSSKKAASNLTNIKQKQNTTRKRLEKVVFNRSAMKRVAKDLNK